MVIELPVSTNLHVRDCKRLISQCSLTPFAMLAILIVHTSTGVIDQAVPMESALLLVPLHDPKDVATFHSGCWNIGTSPDLTFVSVGPDSCVPDRRILEKIPRSQHQPSLIVPPRLALPVPRKPVERWNFRKANWSHYNALTKKLAKTLLSPGCGSGLPGLLQCHQNSSQKFCPVVVVEIATT